MKESYPAELLQHATEQDYGTEYLDYKMSVKSVDTIEQAIDLTKQLAQNTKSTEKYYVKGSVSEIWNATYGNFNFGPADNQFTVYGSYSSDGSVAYADMQAKVALNDEIIVTVIATGFEDEKEEVIEPSVTTSYRVEKQPEIPPMPSYRSTQAEDDDNDSEKIDELFSALANAIANYDDSLKNTALINVPSFYMVGTKLIQNDSIRFKMSCNRKNKQYDGELSIGAIKSFLEEKELDITTCIRSIKLSVEYGNHLFFSFQFRQHSTYPYSSCQVR